MNEGIATWHPAYALMLINLTLTPSLEGEGGNNREPSNRQCERKQNYGVMPPRWTKTLPLGPMRTQLTLVRLNWGVQIG